MRSTPRPLAEQVIVITGGSSGIGLATARLALDRGARVVVAARSPEVVAIAEELAAGRPGAISAVIADVSIEHDVHRIAARAIDAYGRIDTWVSNAGSSVVGRAIDVPIAEMRAVLETDFWGVVYGARIAVEHMRNEGGTLIHVGSVLSDRGAPLMSSYSAAKHAVKAFTDALRIELAHDGIPVRVSLIKPSAIDSPFNAHAKSHLDHGYPAAVPPVYPPEAVARAILACAESPAREVAVGLITRAQFVLASLAPPLADRAIERVAYRAAIRDEPFEPRVRGPGEERGDHRGVVLRRSTYAELRAVPGRVLATVRAAIARLGAALPAHGTG